MRCPFCGHENISGTDLCDHCGADLGGLDLPSEQSEGVTRSFHEVRLADLQPPKPITLPPTASAGEAIEAMRKRSFGAVFVVQDGVLTGIFTERDALSKLALERRDLATVRLSDVMTPDPEALTVEATLGQALHLMSMSGYRHVPVVDEKRHPVGFVSVRGALNYLHYHVLD